MAAGVPWPGSPDAVTAGCTCDPVQNRNGQGWSSGGDTPELPTTGWFINITCTLHAEADSGLPV